MPQSAQPVTLIATFRAQQGHDSTVLSLISAYGDLVRAEPGNIFLTSTPTETTARRSSLSSAMRIMKRSSNTLTEPRVQNSIRSWAHSSRGTGPSFSS
jgi:hypothetical protein